MKDVLIFNEDGKTVIGVSDKSVTNISIPIGVKTIGCGAFSKCFNLCSIDIPSSICEISCHSFAGCSSLKEIVLPDGLLTIGKTAFADCSSLDKILIPSNVKSIGKWAFKNCKNLRKVELPQNGIILEGDVFSGCNAIDEEIILNNQLIKVPTSFCGKYEVSDFINIITDGAFANCKGLTSILVSNNNVTGIGESAFYGCENLTRIFSPNYSVDRLGSIQSWISNICKEPVLKKAFLFSCLTGLRKSDVKALTWKKIQPYGDGGMYITVRMQKTQQLVNNPVSEEALELIDFYDGEHEPDAKVFPDFKDKQTGTTLKNWLKAAGITKHITFHCARHTFGSLQVDAGTGIYTVQHMLGHKNVETTQIYANMADESKRESVNRITLKPKITPQLKVVGQG